MKQARVLGIVALGLIMSPREDLPLLQWPMSPGGNPLVEGEP